MDFDERFKIIADRQINEICKISLQYCSDEEHRVSTKCPGFGNLPLIDDEIHTEYRKFHDTLDASDIPRGSPEEIGFGED